VSGFHQPGRTSNPPPARTPQLHRDPLSRIRLHQSPLVRRLPGHDVLLLTHCLHSRGKIPRPVFPFLLFRDFSRFLSFVFQKVPLLPLRISFVTFHGVFHRLQYCFGLQSSPSRGFIRARVKVLSFPRSTTPSVRLGVNLSGHFHCQHLFHSLFFSPSPNLFLTGLTADERPIYPFALIFYPPLRSLPFITSCCRKAFCTSHAVESPHLCPLITLSLIFYFFAISPWYSFQFIKKPPVS